MDFLLKIAFYGTGGISALVIAFFFLANLFGRSPSETWVHKAIVFVSGATAIALLSWSYRLGHVQGLWLAGLGVAVAAVATYFVMMVGGMFLFTNVRWQ